MKLAKGQDGQLSIFFGTTILVVIGIMAFIINIGYFVKAKINLQNAVDAAAYAGASVQARQLTNIAYLNWEMRNVYKEWMFKYYVLGNLNTPAIDSDSVAAPNSDFRMRSAAVTGQVSSGDDPYNMPSICIDFANAGNVGICRLYKIPGLPRFESYNTEGMADTTNAMIDAIVSEKAEDCSKRSQLNFSTANLWAYNVAPKQGSSSLIDQAPAIASDRQGAFPAAFELAVRLRNLEKQVNKAPYTQGVCRDKSQYNSQFCAQTLGEVTQEQSVSNERINKAFLSAWRNIGGAADDDMLKASFTLKEIAPQAYSPNNAYSLSNLLIPSSKLYPKYYLDLKLVTLNLATFYTAFITQTSNVGGIDREAECGATKTGLPVPGYPLGFVKNPNVLTYYAVKGEANFVGLFNPFTFDEGIKLTAVAAAKPFGGRIGPNLFDVSGNETSDVKPLMSSSGIYISSGYVLGLNKNGASADFTPGDPLPISNFWQSDISQPIGGWIGSDASIRFTIPNLIYDYPREQGDSPTNFLSESPIAVLNQGTSLGLDAGLYNNDMLAKFKANVNINSLTPDEVRRGILSARAPTQYDVLNYLVPSSERINIEERTNSFGFIPDEPASDGNLSVYNYNIYAPVFTNDSDSLYANVNDVIAVFDEYVLKQRPSILKYLNAMKSTAANIFQNNSPADRTNVKTGLDAALVLADIDEAYLRNNPTDPAATVSCKSVAGQFIYFYTGEMGLVRDEDNSCSNMDSLPDLLQTYWSQNQEELGEFYQSQFVVNPAITPQAQIFSAYAPDGSKDTNNGSFENALRGGETPMVRNYYSTKFVGLNALTPVGAYSSTTFFPVYSNGPNQNSQTALPAQEFANPLNPSSVGFENSKVEH